MSVGRIEESEVFGRNSHGALQGRAIDNTCIERFWRSAKCERLYLNEYDSTGILQKDNADDVGSDTVVVRCLLIVYL